MSTPESPPSAATPQQQIVVVERKGNRLGVAGFVFGLIGAIFGLIPLLFWIAFPLGVLGLVFGRMGRRRAKREPERGGKGLATAAVILGAIAIILATIGIAIIAFFSDY